MSLVAAEKDRLQRWVPADRTPEIFEKYPPSALVFRIHLEAFEHGRFCRIGGKLLEQRDFVLLHGPGAYLRRGRRRCLVAAAGATEHPACASAFFLV